MARSHSPFRVSGKLDNVLFTNRNGTNYVHMAPNYKGRHKKRMKAPHCDRYRGNLREFAVASTIACKIYKDIRTRGHLDPQNHGPIFRPYSHNILTAKIKTAASSQKKHEERAQQGHWFATEIRTPDIALALMGLNLGRGEAAGNHVTITPFGPGHNPTELKITGLPDAAKAITTAAGHRIECRIRIHQAEFNEYQWIPERKSWEALPNLKPDGTKLTRTATCHAPSGWIPVEIIPNEGIRIPIPECDAGSKHITAVIIEWREHRGFGRRIVRLHEHGIVRIAAIHAPASAFKQATDATHVPQAHHLVPEAIHRLSPGPEWLHDPAAYLEKVLSPIRPIPQKTEQPKPNPHRK